MKTFAASVGLLALGTSVLNAVENKVLNSLQSDKPWSVSASLRGFYDSNISSTPKGTEQESSGFQINPTINYGIAGEQTSLNLGYYLAANWYDNPYPTWSGPWELTQTMEAALSHTFSPRVDVNVKDSFVIGQEPDVLQVANSPFATSQTINGSNKRNYASLNLNLQATTLLGFQVGYGNLLYNYDDSGPTSNSALLNRMENSVHLDSRWTLQPQTVGIIGYMFSDVNYTADEVIGAVTFVPPGTNVLVAVPVFSDRRNSRGNTFYVGAEHTFTPDISGKLNVGAQIFDYYNDPTASTKISPYVQGSLTYMYRTASSLQAGIALQRSPTDAFNSQGLSYVLDAETLVLYGAWVHEIIPHLSGNLNGSFQAQKFNGGSLNDEYGYYYRVGLGLSYEFTKLMSASVGYNWDQADNYAPYNRNRVYIGLTAAY
jgi:hypothetical protein